MQAELDGQDRIDRATELLPVKARAQPDAQAALSKRLLSAIRELLDGYEQLLTSATGSEGTVSEAGALRQLEGALSRLPGVQDVALRESEGGDRAIIEVRLS